MIGLGWLAYVRTGYRDSANNESHPQRIGVQSQKFDRFSPVVCMPFAYYNIS